MAKVDGVLGICVRHGKLALSIMRGGKIQKTVWEEIPDNIVDDYKILTENLFAEFLKEKMKENGIKAKKAAYVIADGDIFIKTFRMPMMDDEQLKFNIPFEFRDYITGELNGYAFDYVKREKAAGDDDADHINILAFAIPIAYMQRLKDILKLAGLKLERAVPETSVYETILSRLKDEEEIKKERCFLEIGNNHINMRVFKDGAYKLSHIIDVGERHIIQAIADELNVDMHLATTYVRTNYQDCQESQGAINAYKDISLEVMKGLNFYDMSDMSSRLRDVVLCGAGAMITPLADLLKERVDKSVTNIQELFPHYSEETNLNVTFGSVGILRSVAAGVGFTEAATSKKNEKKSDFKIALAGIPLIIIAAILFSKFAVVDRYTALTKARAYQSELQSRVDADMAFIQEAGELSEEYYHYTWDDMTEEELGRVSRVEVAKLADFIASQGVAVNSMSLSDDTLTVSVTGDSLNTMSKLTAALTELTIVESCSLSTAQKEYVEETQSFSQVVESSQEDEISEDNKTDDVSEEETASDGDNNESESDISTNHIVNAQINIYLTTLQKALEEEATEP